VKNLLHAVGFAASFVSITAYAVTVYPNFTGTNSFTQPDTNNNVTATTQVTNNTGSNITQAFNIGWYTTPTILSTGCDYHFVPSAPNSWVSGTPQSVSPIPLNVGVQSNPVLSGSIGLNGLTNYASQSMTTGAYCFWSYADVPSNFDVMGGFFYTSPADAALADATYTYEGTQNYYSISGETVNAYARLYNNSSVPIVAATGSVQEYVNNWVWVPGSYYVYPSYWVDEGWTWYSEPCGSGYGSTAGTGGILRGGSSGSTGSTGSPGAGSPGAGSPGAGSPGAGSPGAGSPGAGSPGAGSPGAGSPGSSGGNDDDCGYWADNGYWVYNYGVTTGYWQNNGSYQTVTTTYQEGADVYWYLMPAVNENCSGVTFSNILNSSSIQVGMQTVDHLNIRGTADNIFDAQIQFDLTSYGSQLTVDSKYCLWSKIVPLTGVHNMSNYMVYSAPITYGVSTSVDSVPGVGKMNVFPNPATTQISVSVDSIDSGSAQLEIASIDGRIVMNLDTQLDGGAGQKINIDITNLASGTYIIHMMSGGNSYSTMFIKQGTK